MSNKFYFRLAWDNIKKNSRTYVPYILTCIGMIMMYYIMSSLSSNSSTEDIHGSFPQLLGVGVVVISIFAVIFLFYTNSFLIKRRKKEFGVFNILGMEKRHLGRVLAIETIYIFGISIISGLGLGILFSKFVTMAIEKILRFQVVFKFEVPAFSIKLTITLFLVIFILTYLNTLRQIHLANPVELLRGGEIGEREPKTKWIMTILGVLLVGTGYYLALTTESPLDSLMIFMLASIIVMIGTYFLFIAGSITLLKMLRKNKSFYYQTKHFTSVSGMIYRMKQNAVGLANICILATAVLVTVSTTVSLYLGVEDSIKVRYRNEVFVSGFEITEAEREILDQIMEEETDRLGITVTERISYRALETSIMRDGNEFHMDSERFGNSSQSFLTIITAEEYKNNTDISVELGKDEMMLYTESDRRLGEQAQFGDRTFEIIGEVDEFPMTGETSVYLSETYSLIVADEQVVEEIRNNIQDGEDNTGKLNYYAGINTKDSGEKQQELISKLQERRTELGIGASVSGREEGREEFYMMTGGFFFMGIFIGLIFLMATVLIIYYKQITEGFDDKERFQIMQKVGMSHKEVRSAIRSQVLTVFFLPLAVAVIHITAAFPIVSKLLRLFGLTNTKLFAGCTVGTLVVFALCYAVIYTLTAKVYYKIVKQV